MLSIPFSPDSVLAAGAQEQRDQFRALLLQRRDQLTSAGALIPYCSARLEEVAAMLRLLEPR